MQAETSAINASVKWVGKEAMSAGESARTGGIKCGDGAVFFAFIDSKVSCSSKMVASQRSDSPALRLGGASMGDEKAFRVAMMAAADSGSIAAAIVAWWAGEAGLVAG